MGNKNAVTVGFPSREHLSHPVPLTQMHTVPYEALGTHLVHMRSYSSMLVPYGVSVPKIKVSSR